MYFRVPDWLDIPDCLEITATSTDDNLPMAFQHKHKNWFGVQFHPESICSQFGREILYNFVEFARRVSGLEVRHCQLMQIVIKCQAEPLIVSRIPSVLPKSIQPRVELSFKHRTLSVPETFTITSFAYLYHLESLNSDFIWLDSSKVRIIHSLQY